MRKLNPTVLTVFYATLLFTAISTNAQSADDVNLNVIINEIAEIKVNSNNVNININTAEDVTDGKTKSMSSHIEITSTVAYELRVTASSDLIGQATAETIGIENVKITVPSTSFGASGTTFTPQSEISPTTSGQGALIGSTDAGDLQRLLDVEYKIEGGEHLLVSPDTYTTTLTYTLFAL